MISLISIAVFIASVLNMLLFSGKIFISILTGLLALGFLTFYKFFAKNLKAPLVKAISIPSMLLLLIFCLGSGLNMDESGFIAYDAEIDKIDKLLQKEDYYKVLDSVELLEKSYGSNDKTAFVKARAALGNSDLSAAGQYLSSVSNKRDPEYYTLMGYYYLLQDDYQKVQQVYLEAAKSHPLWSEAQLMAGAQAANNKDYSIAEYYLLRAAEQDTSDPRPLYYLGVISFEQNSYSAAQTYFSDAVRLKPDGDLPGFIAWYQQKLGGDN